MPNTTNFNWPTPADTDLVKDGAAAIRNLGNGVDTSLLDLKGGTTGQILSKASNADMDFTFITPNVGDITEVQAGTGISVASGTGPVPVITNTVATAFDAAGDLVYGTGADTFAKLSLGTAGQVLKVNSGATAPEWGTAASGAGFVFIAAQSFSAAASTSMNSIFTSTYAYYRIIMDFSGTGDFLYVRLRASGSDNTAANYQSAVQYANKSTAAASHDENGTQFARLAFLAASNGNISFDVLNPQLSVQTLISQQGGFFKTTSTTIIGTQHGAGLHKGTESFDGITFFGDTGTITGKVKVYGYSNS